MGCRGFSSGMKRLAVEVTAKHLMKTLREHYPVFDNWKGNKCIGIITLDWDYHKQQVYLTIPDYVKKGIKQF